MIIFLIILDKHFFKGKNVESETYVKKNFYSGSVGSGLKGHNGQYRSFYIIGVGRGSRDHYIFN